MPHYRDSSHHLWVLDLSVTRRSSWIPCGKCDAEVKEPRSIRFSTKMVRFNYTASPAPKWPEYPEIPWDCDCIDFPEEVIKEVVNLLIKKLFRQEYKKEEFEKFLSRYYVFIDWDSLEAAASNFDAKSDVNYPYHQNLKQKMMGVVDICRRYRGIGIKRA